MKYIKSYQIFESLPQSNWTLMNDMVSYLYKLEYDISVNVTSDKDSYSFIYQSEQCNLNRRRQITYDSGKEEINYVFDLYKDNICLYKDCYDILNQIERLYKSTSILVQLIGLFIFSKRSEHYKEVSERISEFDVIKNGHLDLISLNNLFDFYDIPFNSDEFEKSLNNSKVYNTVKIHK